MPFVWMLRHQIAGSENRHLSTLGHTEINNANGTRKEMLRDDSTWLNIKTDRSKATQQVDRNTSPRMDTFELTFYRNLHVN